MRNKTCHILFFIFCGIICWTEKIFWCKIELCILLFKYELVAKHLTIIRHHVRKEKKVLHCAGTQVGNMSTNPTNILLLFPVSKAGFNPVKCL